MKPRVARWVWGAATVAGLLAVSVLLLRFPWRTTVQTLEMVNTTLLAAALMINLVSPLAKGWAWHLLLAPIAPNRWWVAEEANLIGTAVNSVAAGVTGEAARISLIVQRDAVPLRAAVLSVVSVALVAVLAISRLRGWQRLIDRLPAGLRAGAAELAEMSWGGRLIAPTALALVSWAAEWATYHLTLRAVHLPVSYAASFTALIAVNVGGLIRVTPGNVGVLQAAMVGALLPFGIAAEQAVAGGLALQAIEVLPVLALALAVAGRAGLARPATSEQLPGK